MRHLALLGLLLSLGLGACEGGRDFARVKVIKSMSEVIGGPTAAARPGDYLLENDRIRAVVHGRLNQRSTFPISNGSLVDLDIQRPKHRFGVGKGKDAFYELGPMVNLAVNNSASMIHGQCGQSCTEHTDCGGGRCVSGLCQLGGTPCPTAGQCVRVSASGEGENIIGMLGLLDFAIKKEYPSDKLQLVTDYDLCPGEPLIRVSTTARFYGKAEAVMMEPLNKRTSMLDVLLGEHTGVDCAKDPCPNADESCDDLLLNLSLGTLKTEMKRCRKKEHKLAGVMSGDFMFFSGKVHVFIPGHGYDHETYIRGVFDTGGDVFSNPLDMDFVAGIGDGVSYAYFGAGRVMVPVFAEAFTIAMTNSAACTSEDRECFKGKELSFKRYVSVGRGDLASALEGYYKVRGIATGQITGRVIDFRSRKPISKMDVFVFKRPQAWQQLSNEEVVKKTYEEMVAANRQESKDAVNTQGEAGAVSHFRSDIGLDEIADGSFGGPLAAGDYIFVAANRDRPPSVLVPVRVANSGETKVTIIASEYATVEFDVRDGTGQGIPSKVSFGHCFPECARNEDCGSSQICSPELRVCMPAAGYKKSGDCRPDQLWDAQKATCTCPTIGRLPLELGGARFADGTARVVQTASGTGAVRLPPAVDPLTQKVVAYQVIASRGLEYETSWQFLSPQGGLRRRIEARLPKVVDTKGWISADFHVHGPNSVDTGLGDEERVLSYAAEGVELMTATDHDQLTDYRPAIYHLGLERWLKSQVGLEVSPLDFGHFLGFPMPFDENQELNNAFHWRVPTIIDGEPGAWEDLVPIKLYRKMRERGTLGDQTIVAVAHFYDHFAYYDLNPWTLEVPDFSVTSLFNRVLLPNNFTGRFDALELFNGKNMDTIRRPTWSEVRGYNQALGTLLADKTLTNAQRQAQLVGLSYQAQKDFLRRSAEEQKLAIDYSNGNFECRCSGDEECGDTNVCDLETSGCISRCAGDEDCDAVRVATGREACMALTEADATRRVCQRKDITCTVDADCEIESCTDSSGAVCVKGDDGCRCKMPYGKFETCVGTTEKKCGFSCETDKDCSRDGLRPACDLATKSCVAAVSATDNDPCPTLRGTVDDWFQMLNRGVWRPVLGNSDSHDTYGIEAGIPRNYVAASGDLPISINEVEIAEQIRQGRLFASYGPFIDFKINGQSLGAKVPVEPGKSVRLSIRIQSPTWFDVDRVEVYRNGQLLKAFDGRVDCSDARSCIRVPNKEVVNLDATIEDSPPQDAWYVVIAMGLDGKSLAPVYSSTPVARLGIFEIIQRLTPILPPLRSLRTPFSPSISTVRPYAVTNPIWVDVGDDGLKSVSSPPLWATEDDREAFGNSAKGLSQDKTLKNASTHNHQPGLAKMRDQAKGLMKAAKEGKLSQKVWQRAFDTLRYVSQ